MKTIEEKAKTYDEALTKIQEWKKKYVDSNTLSADGTIIKDLEEIFPELRESEEETTRKELLDFVRSFWTDHKEKLPQASRWVSYLEKQKEQKQAEGSGTDGDIMQYIEEGEKRGIKEVISFPERYGLQKEQKSEEWSKEDENKIESIKYLITTGHFTNTSTIQTIWNILDDLGPHWKPSEEQVEAVRYFVNKHQSEALAATSQWKEFIALRGLLDILQKLM